MESKRQPLSAKAMNPTHLNLRAGERRSLVCPDCKRWRFVKRGLVNAHFSAEPEGAAAPRSAEQRRYHNGVPERPNYGPRCPGSQRRLVVDLSLEEWKLRHDEVLAHTALRRSTKVTRKPRPKPAPAVSQMPSLTQARKLRDQHVTDCPKCRAEKSSCQAGAYLTVQTTLLEIQQAASKHATTCARCKKQHPCGARDWIRLKAQAARAQHDLLVRVHHVGVLGLPASDGPQREPADLMADAR